VPSMRRLSAIMFTDMVGSTASTQFNEAAALKLREEQEALVRPLFADHQGREIKSMGDGFLAEFDSALRATECALEIQRRVSVRNAKPGTAPLHLRIGVHLGDVEQQGGDIFGDAVNIASRIQTVAEPDGICVSNAVYEQVWNKVSEKLEKLPPTTLKGLRGPMDLFRVVLPWASRGATSERTGPAGIAVLPFKNISPDPKDEYIAEGLTEELISVISQVRGFRVISRTSVMQYQSTTKAISQVGAELGVSSILEGSVRKAGSRLRITAQLIEAASDRHLWAKSYDRELDDVFAIQSEIAGQVAEALKVELRPAEEARLESRPAVRPDAYLAYLKGRTLSQSITQPDLEEAKRQFELAISLDDRNAAAYAGLSYVTQSLGVWYADSSQTDWEESSRRWAEQAIKLDPGLPEAHATLARFYWRDWNWAAAEGELKRSLALNPSSSLAHFTYGVVLGDLLRPDETLIEFSLAEAGDPFWIHLRFYHIIVLIWLERFEEAHSKIEQFLALPQFAKDFSHGMLATYHIARGNLEEGLKELQTMEDLEKDPQRKIITRAMRLTYAGERAAAKALLQGDPDLSEHGQNPGQMAFVYAELGELDECFRLLNLGIERHNLPLQQWRLDPRLARVRADPRFQTILKKVNLA
jgi:adenylate cyclase